MSHTNNNKKCNNNSHTQTNVIKGLTPTVFDYETGELLSTDNYYTIIEEFADYVSTKSKTFIETYKNQLLDGIPKYQKLLPTSIAKKT